jgi:RNase P/RNase MRP subunit p29
MYKCHFLQTDLEGIDEFATDAENLATFLRLHDKPAPQFVREIAPNTLLVGLSTTVFRDAEYTSHEVVIDDAQIAWFEDLLATHPNHRIFVFTHAPPSGSGLRVLQENHVVNGCCWLNQSSNHNVFINLVRRYPTIKAWFSGHFHLGHDYQDSITFPVNANRGSCVFCQVSVMRQGSSRDGRRQSRLLRGNEKGFEICTIDHNDPNGNIRVDTTILYETAEEGMAIYAHEDRIGGNNNTTNGSSSAFSHEKYFKVYQPFPGDDTNPPDQYLLNFEGSFVLQDPVTLESIHWWYLACGRILGIHQGILLEYDASTMAPMGLVVGSDELLGKRVAVIDSGLPSNAGVTGCVVSDDVGMEGADCVKASELREQAVVLIDDKDNSFLVVQPNEDGSYWRKIVRNKMIRMKELRREKAAKELAKTLFDKEASRVVSSWGPYVTTSSWARKTGVEGLTSTTARRGQQ